MITSSRAIERLAMAHSDELVRRSQSRRAGASVPATPARVRLGNTLIAAGRRLGGHTLSAM